MCQCVFHFIVVIVLLDFSPTLSQEELESYEHIMRAQMVQ